MAKILVIDDERTVREGLKRLLSAEGFSVALAKGGDEGVAMFREHRPDAVLLDVMMPRKNGFAVCAGLREESATVPILFLTALDSEVSEVKGMGIGADDYIQKSASPEILVARIRRAIDRAAGSAAAVQTVRIGKASVDLARRTVSLGDGGEERLTGTETDLLRILASDRTRYFTYAELAGRAMSESTLRSQISRLKRKLGTAGELIRGERGAGYRLLP